MKKIDMKAINKGMGEFDKFVNNDHAEFICNLVALGLAVASGVVAIIGQYAKNQDDKEEE